MLKKFWQDTFNRRVVFAVAVKFCLMAALWLLFVKDVRWAPAPSDVHRALIPIAQGAAHSLPEQTP